MDQNDSKSNEWSSIKKSGLPSSEGWLARTFGITSAAGKFGCISSLFIPLILVGYCSYQSEQPDNADQKQVRAEPPQQAVEQTSSDLKPFQAVKVVAPTLTGKEREMVCKAGIAIMMGRDPKTMTAKPQGGGVTRIQYRRPDDNKLWKMDCRIDGNRFMWRGVDSFGNDGPGRWRNSPEDEVINFSISGKVITMTETFSDGSVVKESYQF